MASASTPIGTAALHRVPDDAVLSIPRRYRARKNPASCRFFHCAAAFRFYRLDAKYRYNLWRPITVIRNGDIDGNPVTDSDPTWQPLANTPMHPEYPCSHCIQSGSVAQR
jgi:hypothetical protein